MGARRTALTAAGLTAVAALLATGTASATVAATGSADAANNVLTYGSAGGDAVAIGDVLTASLVSGTTVAIRTTSGGSTGITCTASQFTASVATNPAAPGTATESVTAHTFSGCTSNILGTTGVQSITLQNLPHVAAATSAGALTLTAGTSGAIQTTVVLNTILGVTTCGYTSTGLNGTTSNTGNTITFTNQLFTRVSGPITCPASSYFSAVYGPVRDTSQSGSPAVFVN
ncbi:Tat pathway signal sequence domain protein [Streptomyces paludis]|uniref:Tat pathway signal sequence domain protein n=1 Tax=Streptomyces paludis TaxID=2282738 RepID=A0A345HZJ2_9ACTN|nr:Tat pathway signal sequence domain protein [Streptomyces paludis]AXG82116.1 Tat pathway signal sequence domain protein [Streptomyces paludis]